MAILPRLLLLILPLLAAYNVYVWFQVREVPSAVRVQHPPLPNPYRNLKNPLRDPSEETIRAFLSDPSRRDWGMAEARRQLLSEYTGEGRVLYEKNCSHCHGAAGAGDGPMARGLRLRPANFTDRSTIAAVPEAYLFWRIKEGGIGLPPESTPWESAMPPWGGTLSDEEIWKTILGVYDVVGISVLR